MRRFVWRLCVRAADGTRPVYMPFVRAWRRWRERVADMEFERGVSEELAHRANSIEATSWRYQARATDLDRLFPRDPGVLVKMWRRWTWRVVRKYQRIAWLVKVHCLRRGVA